MNDFTLWGRTMGGLCGCLFLLAACTSPFNDNDVQVGHVSLKTSASPGEVTHLFPWGSHDQQVGYLPRAAERRAAGVSAVAFGPGGALFLLDRHNGRVIQVHQGELKIAARVSITAEELSVGPAGTLAIYSPLHATVRLYDRGIMTGEVTVPRILRQIQHIALGPSRSISVQNAYQETLTLGPPALPQSLETILHSRRRGAAFLPDGTGVAARLTPDGSPELILLGLSEKAPLKASFPLRGKALAARIIGAHGYSVCLRLERAAPGDGFNVHRRAVCLDARSGERLLDRDLGRPGLFLPRRELTLGGSPARLAFIKPEQGGLRLTLWPLSSRRGEEG